jgi:hypothetical protein
MIADLAAKMSMSGLFRPQTAIMARRPTGHRQPSGLVAPRKRVNSGMSGLVARCRRAIG